METTSHAAAPPPRLMLGERLIADWAIATEEQAGRMARPTWGVLAAAAFTGLAAIQFHHLTIVGLPLLLLLAFFRTRETASPTWALIVLGLTALVAAIGWAHGASEWTSGDGEFKLMLVAFCARCAWAENVRPRVRRSDALAAFS